MRLKTEDFSKSKYAANDARPVSVEELRNAYEFKKFLRSNKVRRLGDEAGPAPMYCCWERDQNGSIGDGQPMSKTDATKLLVIHSKLRQGQEVSYEELKLFGSA